MPDIDSVVLDDYDQLSPRLYQMLTLIHDAGELKAAKVATAMNLDSKAALIGLESALKRWIPSRGLPLPIAFEGQGDQRAYRWLAGRA